MKVTLINYTGMGPRPKDVAINDWHWQEDARGENAVDQLIFTKSTRLTMSPSLLSEIAAWPWERKLEELRYMANTIPSSWEFVDYTFMIEGVTRAFTHQFVRSRQFSFAQQTMRVLDVSEGPGWDYLAGPTIDEEQVGTPLGNLTRKEIYQGAMSAIDETYKILIAAGAKIEDARGILPTNILTNIVGKCNMRTFVELVRKRSSPRTQNEYRDVLDAMKESVRQVHPWIDLFIERDVDKAITDLQLHIDDELDDLKKTTMTKLLDQIRAQS